MILRLEELDPLWREAGAAERGTLLHAALRDFSEIHPARLPAMPSSSWWRSPTLSSPRRRSASPRRPSGGRRSAALPNGFAPRMRLCAAMSGAFMPRSRAVRGRAGRWRAVPHFSARADRIDEKRDGSLRIIDYKTGALLPSAKPLAPFAAAPARSPDRRARRLRGRPRRRGQRTRLFSPHRPPSRRRVHRAEAAILTPYLRSAERGVTRLLSPTGMRPRPIIQPCRETITASTAMGIWRGGGNGSTPHSMRPATMDADEEDRRHQWRASDPALSAFVSANAGSGKTHVLVARVVRLMLSGTPPARILCLTFTRAAAAEMAERLFSTLSHWLRLSDEELIAELHSALRRCPLRRAPGRGAPPVRPRHRDARRSQGSDHPRLLRTAAAALSLRGRGRRRALPCSTRRKRPSS